MFGLAGKTHDSMTACVFDLELHQRQIWPTRMRRSLAESSWKMPWWSSSFQVNHLGDRKFAKSWFGWEILFMLVFFSQSVHYICSCAPKKNGLHFQSKPGFWSEYEIYTMQAMRQFVWPHLFLCGMYCILHPFQKCQWKVRIDIGIFIGNAFFRNCETPPGAD